MLSNVAQRLSFTGVSMPKSLTLLPEKVISGGQTGADQAGLVAAARFAIPTGGWMPHGFETAEGSS